MARARSYRNSKLDEALTSLVQAQEVAQAQIAQAWAEIAEVRRQQLEFEGRITELLPRIEKRMGRIEFMLRMHTGMSADAVRLEDFHELMADLPARIRESFGLTPLEPA